MSIDNAVALAGIASKLPVVQQVKALRYGILGAYVGRGLMILFAGLIISFPILKIFGALYLLYVGIGHFFEWPEIIPLILGKIYEIYVQICTKLHIPYIKKVSSSSKSKLLSTIIAIEFADLAFSVDNVVAVVAVSQELWIVILAVCISIVLMRFAAGLFIKLIEKEPMLQEAAFVLIMAIGIEMLMQFTVFKVTSIMQFVISLVILGIFIIIGRVKAK